MTMPANNPFAPFVGPFKVEYHNIVDSRRDGVLRANLAINEMQARTILETIASRMNDTEPRYSVGEIEAWLAEAVKKAAGDVDFVVWSFRHESFGIAAFTANKEGKT